MGEHTGTTALALAIQQRPEEEEPEQLGLWATPETEAGQEKQRRGVGRPQGARNKRTERTVAWLLSRHRDPVEVLLEVAEANLHDLAGLLGCSLSEALAEKRLAAIAVLPYLKQRQPLAVDVTNHRVVHLTIVDGLVDQGDGLGIVAPLVNIIDGEAEVLTDAAGAAGPGPTVPESTGDGE